MHGPQLGPYAGQRSREDIGPGRGRQTLFWVKGVRLAPQTGSLSVQVWFHAFGRCGQTAGSPVSSPFTGEDQGQGPESNQKEKVEAARQSPVLTSTYVYRELTLGAVVPSRVAAQSPGPPQLCLTITHSLSSCLFVPTSAIAVSPPAPPGPLPTILSRKHLWTGL